MRETLELPWTAFKSQVLDTGEWQWIYFDYENTYRIFAKLNDFTVLCQIYKDSGDDQADFETNYQPQAQKTFVSHAQTRFEREDIRLQMCRAEASVVSGEAEVSIKLPGEVGIDPVFIGGGYAFTDAHQFGDKVKKVQLVDVDNILGFGAHTIVASYHDDRVDEANQGWYLWPAPQAGGEVEVDPMGYYGEAVAGLYLELYFEAGLATKVFVDFVFGRKV